MPLVGSLTGLPTELPIQQRDRKREVWLAQRTVLDAQRTDARHLLQRRWPWAVVFVENLAAGLADGNPPAVRCGDA